MSKKQKIGFVGLGRMGSGMVKNLIKSGYPLIVYDLDNKKTKEYENVAKTTSILTEIFECSEVMMLSLPGSLQVESVMDEFIRSGLKNRCVIDTSTSFPESTKNIHRKLKSSNNDFLDASLTGGPANADEGTLNVIVGGDKNVYIKMRSILDSIAKNIFYAGESGSGNIVKLANNFVSILQQCMYAEIFACVEKLGIDPKVLFNVVSVSAGNSPGFQRVAPKMISNKHSITFQMKNAIKDLSYLERIFDSNSIPSFILDNGINMFKIAKQMGLEENDVSEVSKVMKHFCRILE